MSLIAELSAALGPAHVLTGADLARYTGDWTTHYTSNPVAVVRPADTAEVAQVMDELGDDADLVQPLFISIDPERDRRLGLAEFTAAFHPSIIGLAGDEAQTRAAAFANGLGGHGVIAGEILELGIDKPVALQLAVDRGTVAAEACCDL